MKLYMFRTVRASSWFYYKEISFGIVTVLLQLYIVM
jgi:hypothetical protein